MRYLWCGVQNSLSSELNIYKFHQFSLRLSPSSFATFDVNVLSSPFPLPFLRRKKSRSNRHWIRAWLSSERDRRYGGMWKLGNHQHGNCHSRFSPIHNRECFLGIVVDEIKIRFIHFRKLKIEIRHLTLRRWWWVDDFDANFDLVLQGRYEKCQFQSSSLISWIFSFTSHHLDNLSLF